MFADESGRSKIRRAIPSSARSRRVLVVPVVDGVMVRIGFNVSGSIS
jgi:hypothetical protein